VVVNWPWGADEWERGAALFNGANERIRRRQLAEPAPPSPSFFPAIRIVADPSMPPGRGLMIAPPSAEHRLAMEGMSVSEQARYMAENRLAVAFKNIGEPEPPHALDEADRP
jgi:hypothetical protein